MSIQRWLNIPNRPASTLSPGERVLVSEASQAPVPLAGKMNAWPVVVLKIFLRSWNSGPGEPGEIRRAVVLHGAVHGPEDPVGNVGGPGNEEMVAAGHARNLGEGNGYRAGAGRPHRQRDLERLHWRRRLHIHAPRRVAAPSILHCTFFHKPGVVPCPQPALEAPPLTSPAALLAELYACGHGGGRTRVRPCRAGSRRLATGGASPWIIALGKAALPMAQAAVETLASRGARSRRAV